MLKNFVLLFGIGSLLAGGCTPIKTSKELIATFYKNESGLNSIVKNLQTDQYLDSLFFYWSADALPEIEDSYPDVFKKLKSIGIKHLSSHPNPYPRGSKWYYFETEWSGDHPICLIYNAYDSGESKKAYYNKDEVSNETWGLGNNWKMFRWVKDLPSRQ